MDSNRRRFLQMSFGTAGAALLGCQPTSDLAENIAPVCEADCLRSIKYRGRALGTTVSMTVLHEDEAIARQAIKHALVELELVENLMSLYRPTSQLCRLNEAGSLALPHPYLVDVLQASHKIARQTGGAFDVTVQPLWKIYSEAKKASRLPDEESVAATLSNVDWRSVEVGSDRIRFHKPGMAVTLNGIAQGFAADRVAAVLREHGIRHALVNAGEIGTLGTNAKSDAWTVGIQHPRQADAYVSLVELQGRSLATSGDYETTFSVDYRANHIFDPRTGRSPDMFSSVSIVASSSMLADALSTAAFVLDLERAVKLIESFPGADAMFVLKNGRTLATSGFPTRGPSEEETV